MHPNGMRSFLLEDSFIDEKAGFVAAHVPASSSLFACLYLRRLYWQYVYTGVKFHLVKFMMVLTDNPLLAVCQVGQTLLEESSGGMNWCHRDPAAVPACVFAYAVPTCPPMLALPRAGPTLFQTLSTQEPAVVSDKHAFVPVCPSLVDQPIFQGRVKSLDQVA